MASNPPAQTSAQDTPPKLSDFPGAEVVGGAVLLDGKNMGTLTFGDIVEPSSFGDIYLHSAAETSPPQVKVYDAVPDPVPGGVIDPSKMEPVKAIAKAAVRKRKQNEASVDAMNSPTSEEEADMDKADASPMQGGPEQPPNMGTGASLSTSTSTGASSLSTGQSSLSTGTSSLSTSQSSLSTAQSSLSTSAPAPAPSQSV